MKKILIVALALALLLTLAACKDGDNTECAKHKFSSANNRVEREATCTEEGVRVKVCKKCGYEEKTAIPKKEHTYEEMIGGTATCTEEGSARNTCTRCGHEETESLPLSVHDYKTTGTKRPTCSHSGALYQTCRNCTATRVVPLAPSKEYHKWENWDTVQHCVYCGIIRGSLLPALPSGRSHRPPGSAFYPGS